MLAFELFYGTGKVSSASLNAPLNCSGNEAQWYAMQICLELSLGSQPLLRKINRTVHDHWRDMSNGQKLHTAVLA